jgi:hypothetical protein
MSVDVADLEIFSAWGGCFSHDHGHPRLLVSCRAAKSAVMSSTCSSPERDAHQVGSGAALTVRGELSISTSPRGGNVDLGEYAQGAAYPTVGVAQWLRRYAYPYGLRWIARVE